MLLEYVGQIHDFFPVFLHEHVSGLKIVQKKFVTLGSQLNF